MTHNKLKNFARRTRPAGYTLLELVLVMLILVIVAGMAAPTLRNFGRGRQGDEVAEQLVSVSQWAHTQAVARGEVYRLNIDTAGRTYYLTVQRDGGFEPPGEEFGRKFTFPDTISIDCDFPQQTDGQYVEFQPSGRSDPGNIRLTSPTGEVTLVGCLSATELFQILPPGTQVNWGGWVAAKAQTQSQNQGAH